MKKITLVLIALVMIAVLASCGNECEHTYSGDCDKSCNNCGEAREIAAEHTYSGDCDEECNNCGEARENAAEHTYSGDCDEECDNCGEARENAAEHNYYGDCDSSCHSCGKKREVTAEHNWKPATCTSPEGCEECGAFIGEPLGHKWKDATCTSRRTCTVCGLAEGEHLAHNWEAATCIAPRTCKSCGLTEGSSLGHTPIEDDGDCMTFVGCLNCEHHVTEAAASHKDTNGDHRCENPGCLFPFNPGDYTSSAAIGVGQIVSEAIDSSDRNIIPVISDRTVFEIESVSFNESGEYSYFDGRGLKEGRVTVAFLSSDGANILSSFEYVVKEEEPVRIGEGKLVSDITVDKTEAEVYRDGTLVTYTVTTSSDVDRLEFVQVAHTYQMFLFDDLIAEEAREDADLVIFELDRLIIDDTVLSDTLVENRALGTLYSAEKTVSGDTATWTVKWDLGYTGVRFIRITALDTETETEQTNYVKLNITYPVLSNDAQGFAEALELYVKSNSTAPMLFKTDDGSKGDFAAGPDLFRGMSKDFADRFINTVAYGGNSVEYITEYVPVRAYDIHEFVNRNPSVTELFNGKNVLCDYGYLYGYTLGFYYPISDELRAVIAYKNGWEIDGELFPYAHSILEKASAVLDDIIEDNMTDFEKERAIYSWMYEQGMNGLTNGWAAIPEGVAEHKAIKTAYGLLNGYGGDCMGWSGTFYTLCNMAGIDCVTVDVLTAEVGGADENLEEVDHRINMIRLDGEYYFVEAFWSWQKASADDGAYRYMNMTTEKAATLYSWKSTDNGGPFACDYTGYLVDGQTGELLNK